MARTPAHPEKMGPLLEAIEAEPLSDDGLPETGPRAAKAPLAPREAAPPRSLRGPMSPRRRLAVAILYPLAGTCCNEASLESKAKELNATVVPLDCERSPPTDLAEEHQWGQTYSRITAGEVQAYLSSPPCRTFSKARRLGRGVTSAGHSAPRPLRGEFGRDRYGLKDLDPEEKKRVSLDTLLAVRTAKAAEWFLEGGPPTIIETPAKSEGHPHLFELDEFTALREKYNMKIVVSPQYMFGARTTKPTAWLHANCDLSGWPDACCHTPTGHWNDSQRKSHYSPHPWAIGFLKEGGLQINTGGILPAGPESRAGQGAGDRRAQALRPRIEKCGPACA